MNNVLVAGKNCNKKTTAIILIIIFSLVLFMNSFFIYTSGITHNPDGETLSTRFFLFGPDSYYNMRTCEQTLQNGNYTIDDPLLNYPIGGKGARPPLFNMIAVSITNLAGGSIDALGWAMLCLPAIYGALLVFPIYAISKELFNKKTALISAALLPIMPLHFSTGHGSAFGLFDHDSFLLLLFTLLFFFFTKSLKNKTNIIYPMIIGVILAGIRLSWVADELAFLMISIFLFVYLYITLIKEKHDFLVFRNSSITLIIGLLICLPYVLNANVVLFDISLLTVFVSIIFCFVSLIQKRYYISRYITLPIISTITIIVGILFYLVSINKIETNPVFEILSNALFGAGFYNDKISLTIGESYVYSLSNLIFFIGPVLFWIMFGGLIFFLYKTYNEKLKPEHIFFILIFTIQMWLTTTSGRFINDIIPLAIIFSGFFIWVVFRKVKFNTIKRPQLICILFIFILVIPNVYLSTDQEFHMKTEHRWSEASDWLSQQDTNLSPAKRPAILTWWDYGFYTATMSRHPTVSDNYQSGIHTAANFFISTTEKEALSILIIRILRAEKFTMSEEIRSVCKSYINQSDNLLNIILNPPIYASSYNTIYGTQWTNVTLRVSVQNAMYWDARDIITTLSVEQVNELYLGLINITGHSIGYVGIDSRDINTLFSVISYSADRGIWYITTDEDDYLIGLDEDKKPLYYDTMIYKLFNKEDLTYFKPVYDTDNIKIFKYVGGVSD